MIVLQLSEQLQEYATIWIIQFGEKQTHHSFVKYLLGIMIQVTLIKDSSVPAGGIAFKLYIEIRHVRTKAKEYHKMRNQLPR